MITHWIARPLYPDDQEFGIVMFSEPDTDGYPQYTGTDGFTDIAEAANSLIAERDRALALIDAIESHLDSPDWTHESESDDYGSWIAMCEGRSILRALIDDWKAGAQ